MSQVDLNRREFVSEAITPLELAFSHWTGEPGVPMRFRWRDTEYQVEKILEKWKTTGPCRHGSRERYLRKHWFRIQLADGMRMDIYVDRQWQPRKNGKGWWLARSLSDLRLTARFLPFFPAAALPKSSRSPATLRFCRLAAGKNHQKSPRRLKARQAPRILE